MNDQVATDLQQLEAAREADKKSSWLESVGHAVAKVSDPVANWTANLPKNISVGMMDAAVNAADLMKPVGDKVQQAANVLSPRDEAPAPKEPTTAQDVVDQHNTDMADQHIDAGWNRAKSAVLDFRNQLAAGSDTSDQVTQGIAQYALPFMGFSRLIGGLQGASLLGTLGRAGITEAATAATALAPHDPRFADLMALGKHTEGKLGDAMNTIAPDGSLMNAYINYMTDRSNESDAEGRFKNIVDNLGLSGATAGLIKAGAQTLKGGKVWAQSIADNVAKDGGAIGPSKQFGHVAYHGSPYDFNAFDASKIGTGEGAQSFGHGIYVAEAPGTAKTYQLRLAKANPGTSLRDAQEALFAAKNDTQVAYSGLKKRAAAATDVQIRDRLNSAAEILKGGNGQVGLGKLYTVDIPDEKVGKMLLWDKPLNEQPEVAKAIGKAASSATTGAQVYKKLSDTLGSEKAASEYLAKQGVPGIRYLDAASRDKGAGTHNIVLFNPSDAKIVKKEAGGKELPIEKAQSASRTENAKAAEAQAPKTGVHVMQTGDKEWTLFVNGKASHVYDKASNAMEDLKALENK